jgi:2-polyprenyl-3-methyl-5-hydroxy-6-metoxy-1,4-benzoquinol methylase
MIGASGIPQPYPARVVHRRLDAQAYVPTSQEIFDEPRALAINRARLDNLASLGLPIEGRSVLDLGGGPGHLAQFFIERGCRVVHTDGRSDNVERARQLYPGIDSRVVDVESPAEMAALGTFDIVFSYGLLYHLENPLRALRNMAGASNGLILLESIIVDSFVPLALLDDEPVTLNQALGGFAFRLSPAAIAMAFDRIGLHNVYTPLVPPQHEDFVFEWKNNGDFSRDGHPIRKIFVASKQPIVNPNLISLIEYR